MKACIAVEKQTDFPELTGELVQFENGNVGRVVGVNYDIGITIVNKDDPTDYCICFHGPSSPRTQKLGESVPWYGEAFYLAVEDIKAGEWKASYEEAVPNLKKHVGGYPSAETCPWGA